MEKEGGGGERKKKVNTTLDFIEKGLILFSLTQMQS